MMEFKQECDAVGRQELIINESYIVHLHTMSAALPIGQNIITGLAKVRRKPCGVVECVIMEKRTGL